MVARLSNVFFVGIFIDLLSVALVVPLMASYNAHFGISRSMLGVVQAIYGIMQTLSTPILGTLSDRIGHKPVLMLSLFGTSAAYLVLTLAVHETSVQLFFLSRIIVGGIRQTMSVGAALVIDCCSTSKLATMEVRRKEAAGGLARFSSAASLGFVVGPAIGGYIAAHYDIFTVTLVSACTGFLNGLMMMYFVPATVVKPQSSSPQPRQNPIRFALNLFRTPSFERSLLLCMYLFSFAYVMIQSTLPQLLRDKFNFPLHHTGLVISFSSGINALILAAVSPWVVKRYPSLEVAKVGMIICCVGYLIQTMAPSLSIYILGVVTVSLFSGTADAVNKSTFSTLFDPSVTGEVMSIVFSIDGFNRVLAPILGGLVADHFGPSAPVACACLSCSLASWIYYHNIQRDHDKME